MEQFISTASRREPRNKGKLVDQKALLKLKDICAIRVRLHLLNVPGNWRYSISPSIASCERAIWLSNGFAMCRRRLQPYRLLHSCSGCLRLEPLPGGTYMHWKSAAFGARQQRSFTALAGTRLS